MKKSVFLLFCIAILATACKKKTETESNVMLEEPKVEAVDSSSSAKPIDQASVKKDSVTVKVDSAAKK